ncbi:cysteine-rich and transmembrane domain-containing protein 1 [Limosa lapponica baueri]|uniref:Cysteine-rich and transmembrane domain-containing protein 1 n=1 Tax=Limosa lapponica baueri TaxID=1758121 RepID=A0A2I0U382_LIMLA|nr:cysteine-rich and transmembrane domain-containing protein 1 [Limosa lapponica baueri]
MHSNQVVLLAHTQAIPPDPLGHTSQASQVIKVIRSMDGKMHLHRLQDQCMQMGLKTQGSTHPQAHVYVVEERRRDDTGESACLTACWTALCCCCLWDMLT